MFLSPITRNPSSLMVPALDTGSAPGARGADGERLIVPGSPQAETRRPEGVAGRLPVSSTSEAEVSGELASIEDEVYRSEELTVLRTAGLLKEKAEEGTSLLKTKGQPEEHRRMVNRSGEGVVEGRIAQGQGVRRERAEPQAAAPGERPTRKSDPLALDLNGNGLETTGINNGVMFDIDADGRLDRTSFISGGDAFLALDANNNGRIDDGSELFGDQNGSANGYRELGRYDDNGDGVISSADAVFARLRLLRMDGSGRQSLQSLSSAGVESLKLAYSSHNTQLQGGDVLAQSSSFTRSDGSQGRSGDLLLSFSSLA